MPNDPFADAMNTSGYAGLIGPNPYLEYTGQIPMAGYRGAPTDAMGNPIASFGQAQQAHDAWNAANPAPAQGTTLNSTPAQPQQPIRMATTPEGMPPGETSLGRGVIGSSWQPQSPLGTPVYGNVGRMSGIIGYARLPQQQLPQQPQAAPAPAPTNPIDMRQAYLDALSNPGKVTTPGAQMLPGTSPTGPQSQPSVLAQFLQQHPGGGTTGGGGYSNQGFFSTLNALKQGATT